jgi:myo-inositol-1(or 4)-monophosphatase
MPQVPLPPERTRRRLLAKARSAVTAVAARVVAARERSGRIAVRRKGPGDFVTAIDVAAERDLYRRLCAREPECGFLGEETGAFHPEREFTWIVDPVDGTSNFARGLPCYAVAAACLWRGHPLAAAIWCEPEGTLYSAAAGLGAFRGRRRIRIARGRQGDAAIVGCQWFRGQQRMGFLGRLQADGCRIRTFGSTVVQLALVVMGRLDGNVQQQGRIWDLAAPGLILVEAGGHFTDWQGRPVFPAAGAEGHTATIAGPPNVHRRLLRLLRTRR